MATVQGQVQAVSNKFAGKTGVNVNDKWYNLNHQYHKGDFPEKGDTVEFDDGGKNYVNKLKIVKGEAPTPAQGGSGGSGGGKKDFSLGVELGQAMNLAMQVALASDLPVGSEKFYGYWLAQTEVVYKHSKGLRAYYEGNPIEAVPTVVEPAPEPRKAKEVKTPQPESATEYGDDDDLF